MNRPNNVVPLHRSVRPIDLERAARACGEPIDLIEALRQNEKRREPTIGDDWRSFVGEVRGSPCSHALVAIAAIVFWTVPLVAPVLIGSGL